MKKKRKRKRKRKKRRILAVDLSMLLKMEFTILLYMDHKVETIKTLEDLMNAQKYCTVSHSQIEKVLSRPTLLMW